MLHTASKGVHTSGDSTYGEACLDNRVRMEEHGLNHIQNIRVSESRDVQVNDISIS